MDKFKTLTLTAALLAAPALVFAGVNVGGPLGTTEAEIRAELEAQGYTVSEIEREGDAFEVEVMIDGVEQELMVAIASGQILEIEVEDDEDDDD